MNMELFRWKRALELAKKFTTHLEEVVREKEKYNRHSGKTEETDKAFKEAAAKLKAK